MANYTKTNIYRKQMNKLKLNAKQYAELTGMPYEVVKDIIYDKEGDYSMEIKNLLRKNMMSKHQEIENDYENAKFQAMKLIQKANDETKLLNWYNNVYTPELLKQKLNLKAINTFKRDYNITFDGEKCSLWTYQLIAGKKEYDGHYIATDKKMEFIRQLYDIIENNNDKLYLDKESINKKPIITKKANKINYNKWYKTFNIKQFMREHNLCNENLCNALELSQGTISHLVSKKQYTSNTLEKLYNYVMNFEAQEKKSNTQDIDNSLINEEIEILDTTDTLQDNSTSDKVDNSINQIEIGHDNNAILRMILVSRLTDEEKLLIELFGGKIC